MLDRAAGQKRVSSTKEILWPAPTKGWVQSGNITTAGANQAEVLDNFIPTAQGARLRGGANEYADIGASVKRLFGYVSGGTSDMFAATATAIFDADRVAGGSNAFAEVEGQTSGDWSTLQISTSGGQFLVAFNGADHGQYWDGSNFNPITTVAVNKIPFDGLTGEFAVGETVTGGTSGATAEILSIEKTSTTAGTLKVGTITSGPFQDNEALTDGATGAADAAGASASSSAITITGVATADISQAWSFKERIFMVEGGTQSVWYLPVKSIGGAATEIPLGSLFTKGGSVLFGATWSLDSGSGLDDVCVFVTTTGQIAVYEGTDPASASTWSLVGVYDIAPPLNKHASFKAGGDLAILTEDGIVSITEALKKDRAALQTSAISYPIEDAWQSAIARATIDYPITATLWQSRTLLLVGTPEMDGGTNVSFAANARTGAWGRFTGWDVRCSVVVNDQLYFGTDAGKVMAADSGGNDDGLQYTAKYVPKFAGGNTPVHKVMNHAELTARSTASPFPAFKLFGNSEYQVSNPDVPLPSMFDEGDTWGSGVWGTFIWGGAGDLTTKSTWKTIRGQGTAIAPGVMITSNSTSALVFEILSTRVRYEVGNSL